MEKYTILLNVDGKENVWATSSDPLIATATYRALLLRSELRPARPFAIIEHNGCRLCEIRIDGRAVSNARTLSLPQATVDDVRQALLSSGIDVENLDLGVPLNDVYKKLLVGTRDDNVAIALKELGLPVTNSQMLGWRARTNNRKFRPISLEELYAVALALGKLPSVK